MIVLVTGASSGFGAAMARRFVQQGHRVIAVDDLHDAAEAMLDLVAFLCRTVVAAGQPLLVLGTARTDAGTGATDRLVDPVRLGLKPTVLRPGPLDLERIQDLLAITKLLTVFDTFESEADAVTSFGA